MDYDNHIKEFAGLVNEYCHWSENETSKEDDVFYLQTLLSKLHCWAIQLPVSDIDDEHFQEEPPVFEHQDVVHMFSTLPYQYYATIFNANKVPSEEPVIGDLIDDLTDIYKDLKTGLWYFDRNEIIEAVFYWRTSYGFHWARHVLSAMHAMYCFEQE